jgi:membrane-associated two-gene conflict system component 1 (EACC1)
VGQPGPGEQGALDALTLVADSTVVAAVINVLPEFLRSRKKSLSITATVNGKRVTVTAANVDEVMPILDRLLG